ncbi:MAG: ATP-binding protein [Casimicrobiaceae bacterium]
MKTSMHKKPPAKAKLPSRSLLQSDLKINAVQGEIHAGRLSAEAEDTLNAIRHGQVDALVIQNDNSEKLYALRPFVEIEKAQAALRKASVERKRTNAQLKALIEERERLVQDMHDGCIHSIYAVGLNLEACLRIIEENPKGARQMVADATANLNLVIQELRSFITGHKLQLGAGKDLRTEIRKAVDAARNRGLAFTVEIDDATMNSLTAEQALHLLQIAREGISNSTRHAHARNGRISLVMKRGVVRFEISDDGRGIPTDSTNASGLGLHHIAARALKIGGTARVSSAPNRGTQIVVEIGKAPA